jgi:hypothetical protein
LEKIKFCGWKCYRLTFEDVSVVVAPEIGGRIIALAHQGEELLFVQKEHEGETFNFSKVDALRAEKRKLGFRLWGGDKTWIAPQKDWWEGIPPLEIDAGSYEVRLEGNGFMMISPVCRETGVQITRRVNLDKKTGVLHLRQEMVNKSKDVVHKGIWNVTQLLRPFDIYLPASKNQLRSYHEEDLTLPSHQIVVSEQDGWCKIPCRDNTLFKFGGMVDAGAIVALKESKGGTLAFLKTFDLDADAKYAHSSSVEVFNALDYNYVEMEIHAPLTQVKPGDRAVQSQEWRLKRFAGSPSPAEVYEAMTGNKMQRAAK